MAAAPTRKGFHTKWDIVNIRRKLITAKDRSIDVAKKIYDGSDDTLTLARFKDELQPYFNGIKEVAEAFEKDEASAKGTFGSGLCDFCAVAFEYEGGAWKELLSLSKKKPSAKSTIKPELRDSLLNVWQALGNRLLHSKELQQDVILFVKEIFNIAGEGLGRFQAYKREFGLVDFTDQETKVLGLLNSDLGEAFRKAIKDRIKIVMVDEFQDTSPLQLSIFLKLNEIVGRSIWVGDPKQEVMKGIEAADAKRKNSLIKILPHSWRSRENLIEFSNEVFTRTFANVPAEEVKLSLDDAERQKNERKGGRISVWQKKGVYQYKADALRADLAKRVKKMFEELIG